MALLKKVLQRNESPTPPRTFVYGDYCYDDTFFQIRTFKQGDIDMEEGPKQHIQLDKPIAVELVKLLNQFLND